MPNPTRQEIIDAHDALEALCKRLLGTRYAEMAILAALPPRPQPTMAEVKWDDNKHYLAEAESPSYGKVIMLFQQRDTRNIFVDIPVPEWEECQFKFIDAANLTPTGKRYTLTEVQDD